MKIVIETGNAAFQDGNANAECLRIITKSLNQHRVDPTEEKDRPDRFPLRDLNGNKCGFIEI